MSTWLLIGVLALGTIMLKAVGPVLAGGRTPPDALTRVVALVAPALISALVIADTLTSGQRLVLDARLVGVTVGALSLWLRVPAIVALLLAAATCALVRGLS